MNNPRPVLYAEDDENDAFLMERAFEKAGIVHPLRILPDGRTTVNYLSGADPFVHLEENPAPCLVLLDLKMPGMSGFDVLAWIRDQPRFRTVPVIVVTSSSHESDVQRAYSAGANGYLIKPGQPDELTALAKGIHAFWLKRTPV